jgi:hypothetical protein
VPHPPSFGGIGQGRLELAEAEARVDLSPFLPADHRRGIEQHDLAHRCITAEIDPGIAAGAQRLARVTNDLLLELKGDPPCSKADQRRLKLSLPPSIATTSTQGAFPRSGFVHGRKSTKM